MAETTEAEVLYDVSDRIATVTLNRPHRRNAISQRMLNELGAALGKADADNGVRCVLLTGAGKGFCSGLDLKDAVAGTGIGSSGSANVDTSGFDIGALPTTVLQEMNTPVLGVINGAAAGYGLDLALGCDMRLGSSSTRLLPGFAKRGVVPESGGTWYLPRLVGWSKACQIAMLGRDLDAVDARQFGLLDIVVDDSALMDTAREWAGEIAANAPLAIQSMKRLFREGLSEEFRPHSAKVLAETMRLFGTDDFREGITAFMEGRPPDFQGR